MAALCHVGFVIRMRETTHNVSGGFYHCTKLGSNLLRSFDNIKV